MIISVINIIFYRVIYHFYNGWRFFFVCDTSINKHAGGKFPQHVG